MDTLQRSIQELIRSENPVSPLTDQQIAMRLSISRVNVTLVRRTMGIPDSRERLRPHLVETIRDLMKDNIITTRELTELLNRQGYDISRFTVARLKKEVEMDRTGSAAVQTSGSAAGSPALSESSNKKAVTVENRPPYAAVPAAEPKGKSGPGRGPVGWPDIVDQAEPFSRLLGSQGSLKPLVQQAKAAVLYPPRGLHTIIIGPAGVGKNELAEAMFRFADKIRGQDNPIAFVRFNCSEYAQNPQLLLSQLFGHVKGAFTGADTGKIGLVEKADNGILFLDEVHRLGAEGQEILFHLMDHGRFRRLGETQNDRRANVTLIAATTESPESSLLVTFRRRIPMMIELPALAERPLAERMDIIRHFFREEAARTGTPIRVLKEACQALLLYDCPGNVGQVKSDIQVVCARGFLVHVSERTAVVEIDVSMVLNHVRRGLLKLSSRRQEIDRLISGDMVILPDKEIQVSGKDDLYTLPGEIYQYIETRCTDLRRGGLQEAEINKILGAELENMFRQHLKRVEFQPQPVTREDLVRIVGRDIVEVVEAVLDQVQRQLPSLDQQHLFYCLAMHLSAAVERLRQGKPILNPYLEEVKNKYVLEFELAGKMISYIESRLGIGFPEDEAGFLAMYLRGSISKSGESEDGRVGVLVITHGKVAAGMVDVAARLLGASHARWIEMSLDEDPEAVLGRAAEMVRDADEGKGVLLLVDMGSLLAFGDRITERTGIPTRTLDRVDTIMVVEAIRKGALPGTSLHDLADSLTGWRNDPNRGVRKDQGKDRKTVLTLCLTGDGTAIRLKSLLEKILGKDEVEILPVGAAGRFDVSDRIADLAKDRRIVAIVGTVDPGRADIPFIPAEEIMGRGGTNLVRQMLDQAGCLSLDHLISDEFLVPKARWTTREEILDNLTTLMLERGRITQAFVTDVYRRELMSSTVLEGEVAIPHGDPVHVVQPAIAVANLAESVDWAGSKVRAVCLLALGSIGQETFRQLYQVMRPGPYLERVKNAGSRAEMRDALLAGLGQDLRKG